MALEFTAYQAAVLADDVYALTRLKTMDQAVAYLKNEHGDVFKFSDESMLKGRTGGPAFIKVRTAFGFTLLGQGVLKGHAVLMFRGTQFLADWLTNLNIAVSSSASGEPVHDGFNQAFKSMEPQIREFMGIAKKNKVHTFHCVGHSLGGAIATICGDWISAVYGDKPFIYTFGSPRVGLQTFASRCTQKIGCNRIFRTYHRTDIVPCIPIWPYVHTPNSGRNYYLPSPGLIPLAEYHGMNHYLDSVEGKSWGALGQLRKSSNEKNEVMRWLKEDSPVGFTITTIEYLNKALFYVIDKILDGAAWLISKAAGTTLTLMDRLSMILQKGLSLAETTSNWVLYLMRKIMRVLGMGKVIEAGDLTRNFIRSLLVSLQHRLHHQANLVLSNVLVNGRAV